ncbi:MAG: hypothetical protein HY295_05025 [Thaumarchaeota archaeon]|nr:hypothetical protein [Nitrososphaerota archaeon]
MTKEKDYYEPVKEAFERLFKEKGQVHLEITADKPFSNKLKSEITHRDIIFYFLKEARPDITGFIKMGTYSTRFIIVEIKDEAIKLDHIYQTRKYAELVGAEFVFLVSAEEIPDEIKKLAHVAFALLSLPYSYKKLILCQFDKNSNQIIDWYEENPFEKEYIWK